MSEPDVVSIHVLELLASKICHDLISPVGAVSNGVEILEELGADAGDDVTNLISFSATQASSKLKTMRMAYGLGGSDDSIKMEDVHQLFADYIAGEKRLSQDWDPYADLGVEPQRALAKMVLCGLLLVVEALPKGGVLSVTAGDQAGDILVKGTGENAGFRDGFKEAIDQSADVEDLSPKLVHGYVTGLLAKHYDYGLRIEEAEDSVHLIVSAPPAA